MPYLRFSLRLPQPWERWPWGGREAKWLSRWQTAAEGADKTSKLDFTGCLHSATQATPPQLLPFHAAGTAWHKSPSCSTSSNTQQPCLTPLLLTDFNDTATPKRPRPSTCQRKSSARPLLDLTSCHSKHSQNHTIGKISVDHSQAWFMYLTPTVLFYFFHSYFLSQLTTYRVPSTSKSPN